MRSVPEWIGKTHDSKAPKPVRLRIFERHGGICHISNRPIRAGDKWELDHIKPLWRGGENRESNLAPALAVEHREKSRFDQTAKAKADRMRLKHLGQWERKGRKIQSRGFR